MSPVWRRHVHLYTKRNMSRETLIRLMTTAISLRPHNLQADTKQLLITQRSPWTKISLKWQRNSGGQTKQWKVPRRFILKCFLGIRQPEHERKVQSNPTTVHDYACWFLNLHVHNYFSYPWGSNRNQKAPQALLKCSKGSDECDVGLGLLWHYTWISIRLYGSRDQKVVSKVVQELAQFFLVQKGTVMISASL